MHKSRSLRGAHLPLGQCLPPLHPLDISVGIYHEIQFCQVRLCHSLNADSLEPLTGGFVL